MARPKKATTVVDPTTSTETISLSTSIKVVPTPIVPLSVDYPTEGLNDMARKINEIIAFIQK